jgi:hypothetical protein
MLVTTIVDVVLQRLLNIRVGEDNIIQVLGAMLLIEFHWDFLSILGEWQAACALPAFWDDGITATLFD